ncbi:hypothetical protein BGX26_002638 [Mortierella sp. AD094]|nr:hypothetical protein BGX26_002638 [Mortierella sp. AD094]
MPFIQPTGVNLRSHGSAVNAKETGVNNLPTSKKHSKSNDVPSCQIKNNWVKSADDSIHIFTKTWHPVDTATESVVVFIHDIVEHCEGYQPLFAYFADKGIEVQSFDLPGLGETGARANSLENTGGLLKEIDSAIDRASIAYPSKPLFLMGHGMGGALVLNYVCGLGKRITSLAGIISSSPYLKPTLTGAGARFPSTYNRLGKWYPNISINFPVTPQELTRDHAEQERYQSDGLVRDSVSLQCLGDMIYQGDKALVKRWKKFPVQLPTLLLHGTDDPICSYQATALTNQLLRLQPHNFKFKSWKGHKHDPHWDIDASTVKNEYIHWIRTSSRHFDKVPLETNMVHSDSIKSARIGKSKKDLEAEKRREKESKMKEKQDKKQSKIDKAKLKQEEQSKNQSSSSRESAVASKQVKESAAEPEQPINDLKDLLRQQQLKLEKAEEKRREYGLSTAQDNQTTPATSQVLPISAANDNTAPLGVATLKSEEPTLKPEEGEEGESRVEKKDVSITETDKEQEQDCQKTLECTQQRGDIISIGSRDMEGGKKDGEKEEEKNDSYERGENDEGKKLEKRKYRLEKLRKRERIGKRKRKRGL